MSCLSSPRLNLATLCVAFICSAAIAASPPPPAASPRPAQNPRYELIDVGSIGGLVTTAQHVNDFGEVIGTANTADNLSMHAYLWREGQLEDLGTLGGNSSQGIKVNNRGQAVGNNFNFSTLNFSSAFLYRNGETQILPFDIAYAVNLRNQVVGQLTLPNPDPRGSQNSWVAVLYENGVLTQLGIFPGGSYSSAHDINNRGEIVGGSATDGFQGERAYVYRNGKMIDLGTLGGSTSSADAINALGHITGGAELSDGQGHAFLYRDGHMIDLGTVGTDRSTVGEGINDEDVVVGVSNTFPLTHAIIYINGKMHYLDEFVDPANPLAPYVTLIEGTGVNNLGWITADGYNSATGLFGGYLLRPIRTSSEALRGNDRQLK
jgi:probable HAF family extracellular repeat protein